jgi:hypothetical protein
MARPASCTTEIAHLKGPDRWPVPFAISIGLDEIFAPNCMPAKKIAVWDNEPLLRFQSSAARPP